MKGYFVESKPLTLPSIDEGGNGYHNLKESLARSIAELIVRNGIKNRKEMFKKEFLEVNKMKLSWIMNELLYLTNLGIHFVSQISLKNGMTGFFDIRHADCSLSDLKLKGNTILLRRIWGRNSLALFNLIQYEYFSGLN